MRRILNKARINSKHLAQRQRAETDHLCGRGCGGGGDLAPLALRQGVEQGQVARFHFSFSGGVGIGQWIEAADGIDSSALSAALEAARLLPRLPLILMKQEALDHLERHLARRDQRRDLFRRMMGILETRFGVFYFIDYLFYLYLRDKDDFCDAIRDHDILLQKKYLRLNRRAVAVISQYYQNYQSYLLCDGDMINPIRLQMMD
jgi:hypothetical protein